MRSKTSSFNKGIYVFNLKRFWLIAFAFAFLLTLNILGFLRIASKESHDIFAGFMLSEIARSIFGHTHTLVILLFPFFSLIAALAMFSYIHFQSNTAMIHALPVTRNSLFTTHYLAGLTLVMLPLLISGTILVAGELVIGIVQIGNSLLWILVSAVFLFLFYSFAVFAGMFTGHMAAHALYFFIFNFLAVFLEDVIETVLSSLLFGYVPPRDSLLVLFSPIAYLLECFTDFAYGRGDWLAIACYLLAGLLFTWGARAVYLKRHMETAGDVVSVQIMKPVFKYSVAFCSSALLGNIIVSLMNLGRSFTVFVVGYLIGGFIGYFAAEMLLRKTFRVFRRTKGFIVFALIMVLLLCAINFDLFGYASYVPDARDVEIMLVSNYADEYAMLALNPESYNPERHRYMFSNSYGVEPPARLDDQLIQNLKQRQGVLERPESIEKAIALHRFVIRNASSLDRQDRWENIYYDESSGFYHFNLYIAYRLKSGQIVERSYILPFVEGRTGGLEDRLKELVSSDEYREKANPLLAVEPNDLISIEVFFNDNADNPTILDLVTAEEREAFMMAYRQDILEEDPLNKFMNRKLSNTTSIFVTFNFKENRANFEESGIDYWVSKSRVITLEANDRHTLKYLAEKVTFSEEIWQKLINRY